MLWTPTRSTLPPAFSNYKMLGWYLLALLLAMIICSKYAPHSVIARSAQDAFESSVLVLSTGCGIDDDGAEYHPPAPPVAAERKTGGAPTKRKRVTPFISKKVAARQGFKCAMCGELLQEDWEIDHIVSLQRGGGNELSNYQALHKRCHAFKNSEEQRRWTPDGGSNGRSALNSGIK